MNANIVLRIEEIGVRSHVNICHVTIFDGAYHSCLWLRDTNVIIICVFMNKLSNSVIMYVCNYNKGFRDNVVNKT